MFDAWTVKIDDYKPFTVLTPPVSRNEMKADVIGRFPKAHYRTARLVTKADSAQAWREFDHK